MNYKKRKLIFFIIWILIFNFSPPVGGLTFNLNEAYSSESSSDDWTIQVDELNINSRIPIGTPKKELTKKNSSADSTNPVESNIPLTFTITNSILSFGILSPTTPVYRTTNIYIKNFIKGTIVTAYEDHPLLISATSMTIPDSTCDNGSCSETTSSLWENTLTYGFGYRCDDIIGKSCPVDFGLKNYYRQFSDLSKNELTQVIMSENTSSNIEAQITYKINTSKTQTKGSYSNTITYIASPGY